MYMNVCYANVVIISSALMNLNGEICFYSRTVGKKQNGELEFKQCFTINILCQADRHISFSYLYR